MTRTKWSNEEIRAVIEEGQRIRANEGGEWREVLMKAQRVLPEHRRKQWINRNVIYRAMAGGEFEFEKRQRFVKEYDKCHPGEGR